MTYSSLLSPAYPLFSPPASPSSLSLPAQPPLPAPLSPDLDTVLPAAGQSLARASSALTRPLPAPSPGGHLPRLYPATPLHQPAQTLLLPTVSPPRGPAVPTPAPGQPPPSGGYTAVLMYRLSCKKYLIENTHAECYDCQDRRLLQVAIL